MKTFLIAFICFICMSNMVNSQGRRSSGLARQSSSVNFSFSRDANERISDTCPNILSQAARYKQEVKSPRGSSISSQIVYACPVNSLKMESSSLGPWEGFVNRSINVFKQLRRLLYIGAVFMVIWILVKAAYESEMKWKEVGMLVIGVTLLATAEVFISMATGQTTIEDINASNLYVDCREPNKALFVCSANTKGAVDTESVYLFNVNEQADKSGSPGFKGLF